MNPFDLPGPQFLALFICGGFVSLLVARLVRYLVADPPRPSADVLGQLHADQLAYLVGGLERAVETAIAALHHRGALVIADGAVKAIDREPQLSADGVYRGIVDHGDLSSLERFVLDDVVGGGETHIGAILERAKAIEPSLRDPLVANGLLVADAKALQLKAILPAVVWCLFGVIKVLVGISRDKPVGFLVVLVIALFVIAQFVSKAPWRTKLGDELVTLSKARYAALEMTATTAPQQLSGGDMSFAYAMFGAAMLGPALATLMPSYQRALLAATSDGGGGGSSCGSSCGGGCGGGCGGCS